MIYRFYDYYSFEHITAAIFLYNIMPTVCIVLLLLLYRYIIQLEDPTKCINEICRYCYYKQICMVFFFF